METADYIQLVRILKNYLDDLTFKELFFIFRIIRISFFDQILDYSTIYYISLLLHFLLKLNQTEIKSLIIIGMIIIFNVSAHFYFRKARLKKLEKVHKKLIEIGKEKILGSLALSSMFEALLYNFVLFLTGLGIFYHKVNKLSMADKIFIQYFNFCLILFLMNFSLDIFSTIQHQAAFLGADYKLRPFYNLEYLILGSLLIFSNFSKNETQIIFGIIGWFFFSNILKVLIYYTCILGGLVKHFSFQDFINLLKKGLKDQIDVLSYILCEEFIFFGSFFVITTLDLPFLIRLSLIGITIIQLEKIIYTNSTKTSKKIIQILIENERPLEAQKFSHYCCLYTFCLIVIIHTPVLFNIENITKYFITQKDHFFRLNTAISISFIFTIIEGVNISCQAALEIMNQKYLIYPIVMLSYMLIMPIIGYGGYKGSFEILKILVFYIFIFSINKLCLLYLILFYGLDWEIEDCDSTYASFASSRLGYRASREEEEEQEGERSRLLEENDDVDGEEVNLINPQFRDENNWNIYPNHLTNMPLDALM